jgi:transcriptional regulator with XRE-family HTH domain
VAENPKKAIGRRLREARMAAGLSREVLGEELQVHTGSIARWETGGAVPHPFHLQRIAELTHTSPAWLQYGGKEGKPAPRRRAAGRSESCPEVIELLTSFDTIARFLGGLGPPGDERPRKLDALEGYRRMISTVGAVPAWWYDVKEKVERDEM